MNASAGRAAHPPLLSRVTGTWRRLRRAHPVRRLRWLRSGMLALVCATAVGWVVVAVDGGQEITSVRRADSALQDIGAARHAAQQADLALERAVATGQLELIGTGTEFANATARISTLVTAAAQGNAAGAAGRKQIQFVQGQLTTALELAATAVRDYPRTGRAGVDSARGALTAPRLPDPDTRRPIPGTGGLLASLQDLEETQSDGLAQRRDASWLNPFRLWLLAAAPALMMLGLVLATAHVLIRRFHRPVGPRLLGVFALTAGVAFAAAALTTWDESRLAAHPTAGHPVTMTVALLALSAAGVLNHMAYRPRLAEYRFPRP
ncbi:hypothetical protein ACIP88_19620 [Streptomyces uncialis]|uniref:hypothetical protein n=1 Tax=Streptomyces uncialis TaxID=1048205 RepID=UPI00381508F6